MDRGPRHPLTPGYTRGSESEYLVVCLGHYEEDRMPYRTRRHLGVELRTATQERQTGRPGAATEELRGDANRVHPQPGQQPAGYFRTTRPARGTGRSGPGS